MPDNLVRIEFLKKLHLFRGLSDAELASVAAELKEKTYFQADTVFEEGTQADALYIIFEGRVNISRRVKNRQVKLASLVKGDYFGEQGLLKGRVHNATVIAEPNTIVLILFRVPFAQLFKKTASLRHNFDIMIYSRKLASELHFNWLAENEVIYFLARKHQFLLFRALVAPTLAFIPIFSVLALAFLFNSALFGLIGGFFLVADCAWGFWRYLDWGNDYYIVTNQRVIWLEKVIALYDSRIEAGVATILSVSTEIDFWGRRWDYGTVVVRTFTGQIRLDFVRHPMQAAAMIEEYWNRAKEGGKKADEETMSRTIRAKLGYKKAEPPPTAVPVAPAKQASVKKISPLAAWWANLFRMRTEDGNTITYHKHIYGFFRDSAFYMLGFMTLLVLIFVWPMLFGSAIPSWVLTFVIFGMAVLFGFVVYEYVDWKNDIYQVTSEQIIDVTRKPFGTEDRKAAPLENILSTEYKRTGILGMLLNFGTVYIMVGGAQFHFQDVADPPSVQQDITRRQQGRQLKKREGEAASDRERMSEWLKVYHRTIEEIEQEKRRSNPANPE